MQIEDLAEGQWGAVSGVDAPAGIKVRGVWRQDGAIVNAWVRVDYPEGRHILIHASTDLAAIDREMPTLPGAEVGLFGGLKKLVKKTGVAKIAKGLTSVARKAINNPLVKSALMATPAGAIAVGIANGASIVQKAARGNLSAQRFVKFAYQQASRGNPTAQQALGLLRAGAREQLQAAARVPPTAVCGHADREWVALLTGNPSAPLIADSDLSLDAEQDAILTFASAGAFEGMRWALSQFRPAPLSLTRATTRDIRALGLQAMAQRFRH